MNKNISQNLKNTLEKNPQTTQLNLEFMHLTSLGPYVFLIAQFPNLKRLSLHGNRLKQLPADLSILKTIEELDLSNNALYDVQSTLNSLKTMPKLINLTYDVKSDKQAKVCETLKRLKCFNNTKVLRQIAKSQPVYNIMNKESLNSFMRDLQKHFKTLLKLQGKYNEDQHDQSDQIRFQKQIQEIASQSLEKLKITGVNHPAALQIVMLSTTKHEMYDLLRNRACNICTDIYGDLGKFIVMVFDEQNKLYRDLIDHSLRLVMKNIQNTQVEHQKSKNIEIDPQQRFYKKLINLQNQVKRLRSQKQEYLTEINHIENQNKKYIQLFIRFSKGDKQEFNKKLGYQNQRSFREQQSLNMVDNINSLMLNMISSKNKEIKDNKNPVNLMKVGGRSLTLKQLKDTIEDIYQSKQKFDKKNKKLAKETMNKYIFTYLNQKYGLKSLTIEAADTIISGVMNYSGQDNDVAVFGKILKNQMDEQFRYAQRQLKSIIFDYIKSQSKNKNKSIHQIFQENFNLEITYEEVQKLIIYIYGLNNNQIMQKIQILFKINSKQENINKRLTREELINYQKKRNKIRFGSLIQCILNFEMKQRQIMLKSLVKLFKNFDRDEDGIVNESQFTAIIKRLTQEEEQNIDKMLYIVDPYKTKSITFTQMVKLLVNFPQNNPILKRQMKYDSGSNFH